MLDTLQAFLKDTEEMIVLSRNNVQAGVAYLADIFIKFNVQNSELQGKIKTPLDEKAKICGFISKLQHYTNVLRRRDISSCARLISCDVSDSLLTIIMDQLHWMVEDFKHILRFKCEGHSRLAHTHLIGRTR